MVANEDHDARVLKLATEYRSRLLVLAEQVRQTRVAQQQYFKRRTRDLLIQSKAHEKDLDAMVSSVEAEFGADAMRQAMIAAAMDREHKA